MKRFLAIVLLAFGPGLVGSRLSEAQTVARSFAELQEQLTPGDSVTVTDRQGRETSGTLQRMSATSLMIVANGNEREILFTEVGRIEKPDPLWNGVLIGAAYGATSFMPGAGASCSPHCARDITAAGIAGGLLGALVGARWDRAIRGRTLLYGTGPNSRHALHAGDPVSSVGELWMGVRQGDTISVVDANGRETRGTFEHLAASSIVMLAGGQLREILMNDVRQVSRRGDRLWWGVLIGTALGATAGAIAVVEDAKCSSTCAVTSVGILANVGFTYGAIIGRLLPRRMMLYSSTQAPTVRVMPLLVPGRGGMMLSVQF